MRLGSWSSHRVVGGLEDNLVAQCPSLRGGIDDAAFVATQAQGGQVDRSLAVEMGREDNASCAHDGQLQLLLVAGKVECDQATLTAKLACVDEAVSRSIPDGSVAS